MGRSWSTPTRLVVPPARVSCAPTHVARVLPPRGSVLCASRRAESGAIRCARLRPLERPSGRALTAARPVRPAVPGGCSTLATRRLVPTSATPTPTPRRMSIGVPWSTHSRASRLVPFRFLAKHTALNVRFPPIAAPRRKSVGPAVDQKNTSSLHAGGPHPCNVVVWGGGERRSVLCGVRVACG